MLRLARANVRTASSRVSSVPLAKVRPGAVAAHTLFTSVMSSNGESERDGPPVRVIPLRIRSFALRVREIARSALRAVPTKASTVIVAPRGVPEVRNSPQRPGAGSRTMILLDVATQPKTSALLPAGPHVAPVGATAKKPRPSEPGISRRGDAGVAVRTAGPGVRPATVNC